MDSEYLLRFWALICWIMSVLCVKDEILFIDGLAWRKVAITLWYSRWGCSVYWEIDIPYDASLFSIDNSLNDTSTTLDGPSLESICLWYELAMSLSAAEAKDIWQSIYTYGPAGGDGLAPPGFRPMQSLKRHCINFIGISTSFCIVLTPCESQALNSRCYVLAVASLGRAVILANNLRQGGVTKERNKKKWICGVMHHNAIQVRQKMHEYIPVSSMGTYLVSYFSHHCLVKAIRLPFICRKYMVVVECVLLKKLHNFQTDICKSSCVNTGPGPP